LLAYIPKKCGLGKENLATEILAGIVSSAAAKRPFVSICSAPMERIFLHGFQFKHR
jgi:hypothetical protein